MAGAPMPLHQINAFEAAARHRSFSRAAQELNVQQPTVSRQVAMLEESLGVPLFLRTRPRLTLTEAGETLFAAAEAGFPNCGVACARCSQPQSAIFWW